MRTETFQNSPRPRDCVSRFRQLIDQVRGGDEAACEAIVREYGSVIQREARLRLGSSHSSFLDADDVVQSVLRSFLLSARGGKFDLRDPAQLVRLLTQMARNKSYTALKREGRRKSIMVDDHLTHAADARMSADELWAKRESVEICRQQLGADEWQLLQWRLDGYTWPEIAARRRESADVVRKRLERALQYLRQNVSVE